MLIVLYIASIAIYLIARPRWKFIGPSLFDSYLIGVALFVVGTMLLGFGADIRVESVRTIGLVAGIFSLLGGALWGVLLRRPIHNLKFWSWIREIEMAATERSIVTAGLLVSAAVCVAYVGAILASPGLRALIVDGVQHRMSTPWRLGITDGHYGYFGVGYVKQFRDIAIPVLCGAIILIGEPRARWPFWIGILAGLAAILITQERLIVIEFALCLFRLLCGRRGAGPPTLARGSSPPGRRGVDRSGRIDRPDDGVARPASSQSAAAACCGGGRPGRRIAIAGACGGGEFSC